MGRYETHTFSEHGISSHETKVITICRSFQPQESMLKEKADDEATHGRRKQDVQLRRAATDAALRCHHLPLLRLHDPGGRPQHNVLDRDVPQLVPVPTVPSRGEHPGNRQLLHDVLHLLPVLDRV